MTRISFAILCLALTAPLNAQQTSGNDLPQKPQPQASKPSWLQANSQIILTYAPQAEEEKFNINKAWVDLEVLPANRFRLKFSFDPRSVLFAGAVKEKLRNDPEINQAVLMAVQMKLAAQLGISDPSQIQVPPEVLQAAVAGYVDGKVTGETIAVAAIQGLSAQVTLIEGDPDGRGRTEVEVGKMAPVYFDREDYYHLRIPENGVRVTTQLGRVKVFFEAYKSRFPNLDERVIEDYVKGVLLNQEASQFGDWRLNAYEAGLEVQNEATGRTLIVMGRRNEDKFYAVFQQERELPGGLEGQFTMTFEKGSPIDPNDRSLIKRFNFLLGRDFKRFEAYGQVFIRRSDEISQENVTVQSGGFGWKLGRKVSVGANAGWINGEGFFELYTRLRLKD